MPDPIVLTKIDELLLPDHYHLSSTDECYFLREYTSGKGYQFSETNQLIFNLKKSVERRGQKDWRYKAQAIHQVARELAGATNPRFIAQTTLVPIPPSKVHSDPLYDDRMLQVLRAIPSPQPLDIRELVIQTTSVLAAHQSFHSRDPDRIAENYQLDESLTNPYPTSVVVVDDVLTTGAHFVAIGGALRRRFPGIKILGIFVARRVFPDPRILFEDTFE